MPQKSRLTPADRRCACRVKSKRLQCRAGLPGVRGVEEHRPIDFRVADRNLNGALIARQR
jgi:hypothetical protein